MRREEKYRQVLLRRIVCGGSKRIGRPRGRTALPLLLRFQIENFKVHPSDMFSFPLEFRNQYNYAVLENHSGKSTRPRKSLMISLAV